MRLWDAGGHQLSLIGLSLVQVGPYPFGFAKNCFRVVDGSDYLVANLIATNRIVGTNYGHEIVCRYCIHLGHLSNGLLCDSARSASPSRMYRCDDATLFIRDQNWNAVGSLNTKGRAS